MRSDGWFHLNLPPASTCLQAIGYKELIRYLAGDMILAGDGRPDPAINPALCQASAYVVSQDDASDVAG